MKSWTSLQKCASRGCFTARLVRVSSQVMNRCEPAAGAARAKLAGSGLYVGLAFLMLCRLAGSPSSLASSDLEAKQRADEVQRGIDDAPDSARKLAKLQRAAPSEDETSDEWVVASRLGFEQTPLCRLSVGNSVIAARAGHLLVSTGLGRGPPLG